MNNVKSSLDEMSEIINNPNLSDNQKNSMILDIFSKIPGYALKIAKGIVEWSNETYSKNKFGN